MFLPFSKINVDSWLAACSKDMESDCSEVILNIGKHKTLNNQL
jgi:hypothetical protein